MTALACVSATTALAQAPSSVPVVGTGAIGGRVEAIDGSGPLPRAEVRLHGSGAAESRALSTDERGRYEFTGLTAGRYRLTAERRGYLTFQYGERPGHTSARVVEIGGGQSRQNIDFALQKSGVITVRVTDEFGNPRAGVAVTALQYAVSSQRRRLAEVPVPFSLVNLLRMKTPETDDLGRIRLTDLPPGEYFLKAEVLEFRSRLMDAPDAQSDRELIYPPIYYPGTASPGDAQPVMLDAGQELGVGITLVPARAAHISGRVIRSDGSPGRGHVVLQEVVGGQPLDRFRDDLSDGRFTFGDIRPGEYVIAQPVQAPPSRELQAPPSPEEEYGSLPVTVSGENISDLVLTTARAGTIGGRVVFDTGAPPRGEKPADFAVSATGAGIFFYASSDLRDDWSFTIEGITSPSKVEPAGWWGDWGLKEATLAGVEVTDTPLSSAADLQLVMTRKVTNVAGVVVDERGAAVIGCRVAIFAEDSKYWTPGSRFVTVPRTDQQGRFRIGGLPPGRYLAAAVEDVRGRDASDPDSLLRLKTNAARLTLSEGESKTLNLTLTIF